MISRVCALAMSGAMLASSFLTVAVHADSKDADSNMNKKKISLTDLSAKQLKELVKAIQTNAKTDDFSRDQFEKLLNLASSDDFMSKADNADMTTRNEFKRTVKKDKKLLQQDSDQKIKSAVEKEAKKSLKSKDAKKDEKIDFDKEAKALKAEMIKVDKASKKNLNALIEKTKGLLDKMPVSARLNVQIALNNAQNVSAALNATPQAIGDSEQALIKALDLAGYKVKIGGEEMTSDVDISKKEADDADKENKDLADDKDADKADTADSGVLADDSDAYDGADDNSFADQGAGDYAGSGDVYGGSAVDDGAVDAAQDASSLAGEAASDNDNGLYQYDPNSGENQDINDTDDKDNVEIGQKDTNDTLQGAIDAADSQDTKLKLILAGGSSDILDNLVNKAKLAKESGNADQQKQAYDDLMQALNTVNVNAKAGLVKEAQALTAADTTNWSPEKANLVKAAVQLANTVSANPDASFGDIVQAESAAMNLLDHASLNKESAQAAAQASAINSNLANNASVAATGKDAIGNSTMNAMRMINREGSRKVIAETAGDLGKTAIDAQKQAVLSAAPHVSDKAVAASMPSAKAVASAVNHAASANHAASNASSSASHASAPAGNSHK